MQAGPAVRSRTTALVALLPALVALLPTLPSAAALATSTSLATTAATTSSATTSCTSSKHGTLGRKARRSKILALLPSRPTSRRKKGVAAELAQPMAAPRRHCREAERGACALQERKVCGRFSIHMVFMEARLSAASKLRFGPAGYSPTGLSLTKACPVGAARAASMTCPGDLLR